MFSEARLKILQQQVRFEMAGIMFYGVSSR